MDKILSCCFSGHRSISDEDLPKIRFLLLQETERLIQIEVNHFIAGGAVGFDTLAALTIIELRKEYPRIALELALVGQAAALLMCCEHIHVAFPVLLIFR